MGKVKEQLAEIVEGYAEEITDHFMEPGDEAKGLERYFMIDLLSRFGSEVIEVKLDVPEREDK